MTSGLARHQPVAAPRHRAAALWDHALEVVLVLDPTSGRITAASPSWSLYGHRSQDLVGGSLLTLVHPDDRASFEPYLLRPELARSRPVVRTRFGRGDGGGWTATIARVWPGSGADDGRLVLAGLPLDDTMARLLDDERRAAAQLRVIDGMRARLVELATSELREPLTVIGGFAETLQRPGLQLHDGDLRRVGASIERHVARLLAIVTDVVELDAPGPAALEQAAPHDLAAVVSAALEQVPLAPRALHVDLRSVVATVDRERVQRLVASLLENVREHTPPTTTVWVTLDEQDDGVRLEVADDGPGLPPGMGTELFSPLTTTSSGPGRLGLGLPLAQRFARLHGGRCWYEPRPERGSRFVVSLPRQPRPVDDRPSGWAAEAGAEMPMPAPSTDGTLDPELADLVTTVLAAARRDLGMPVAYLSRFTDAEQVVLALAGDGARLGLRAGQRLPIEETLCARVLADELPNVVPDVRADPRVAASPFPAGKAGSYVGVPVHAPDGQVLGTLCCADDRPNESIGATDVAVLRSLAHVVGIQMGRRAVSEDEQRATAARVEELLRRRDGLRPVYQPIVDLRSGEVTGVEALSRFPDSQIRPPDLWFADAARVGLGAQLEQTAILRALGGLRQLPEDVYLSLNVSPGSVAAGALRPLLGRVPLERVVIEITEHVSIADYEDSAALLRPFRDGGARLAIDDVGAGFASLRHVLRMHPDVIKLDRSLVSDVAADPAQRAVAAAFGELADRLGVKLVAEGIEDATTVRALVAAGISHGQGWFFDRAGPLPLRTRRYPLPAGTD